MPHPNYKNIQISPRVLHVLLTMQIQQMTGVKRVSMGHAFCVKLYAKKVIHLQYLWMSTGLAFHSDVFIIWYSVLQPP